jgi:hypothetical protein
MSMTAAEKAELQTLLQKWDPPAGAKGFEGMVAVAVAQVSELPVRLARSGAQFGRDGLSTPGDFVIAFEAKRYTDRPTLQEMTTKAALAADDLHDECDIWACALPTDLGDLAERLRNILDKAGISLLVLDWPTGGPSPLAALLAAARTQVVEWANSHDRPTDAAVLDRLLHRVAAEDGFAAASTRLKGDLTKATAGLAALARENWDWAFETLASPGEARSTFGQRIVPAHPTEEAVSRETSRQTLASEVRPISEGVTVVLGGEGSGKSWLVADWWLHQHNIPILLFAAGPLHAALNSDASGEEMLAALLSKQHGEPPERWLRRLKRWRRSGDGKVRFALVPDGLNERAAGKKWATIIDALAPVIRDLGGTLIATCRPSYWERNIARRLRVGVRLVTIGDFESEELKTFFRAHTLDLDQLPGDLHKFLANPRVAALAVKVLPRLSDASMLSRDRLLLEYWRSRLEERGDEVAHNDDEFSDLLAEHARQFRDTGRVSFARSRLSQLSEQVVFGGRSYEDDLAEMAEGRFFAPRGSGYEVTGTALPTALGMLLHKELLDADLRDGDAASALIDSALDPVSGFDETANAVAACIALAVAEQSLPAFALVALIVAWFGIQNRNDDSIRSVAASITADPEPFLDAFEHLNGDGDHRSLLELLHHVKDNTAVWAALSKRLPVWLGYWTTQGELYGHDDEAKVRQAERTERTLQKREMLLPEELCLLDRTTTTLGGETHLSNAAIQLSIGMPLAQLAEAIVGYSFVGALKGHSSNVNQLFCWMLRSNDVDFEATHAAVRQIIAPLCEEGASAPAKQAAAIALEALGRYDDAEEARKLWPREPGQIWRSVDRVCDVDPLDPSAPPPSSLENAYQTGRAIDPSVVWSSFGTTGEDHHLDEIRPSLARYDMPFLASLLRSIVRTAPERRGMAVRQLAWHLPELSAILEPAEIAAIREVISGFDRDGRDSGISDRWFVLAVIVEAVLPHLSFRERVEVVDRLPARVQLYDRLNEHPAAADSEEIEHLLSSAGNAGPQSIARRLHMLGAVIPTMSPRSRTLIVSWLAHSNHTVAGLAADVVRRAGDDELDQLALASGALDALVEKEFVQANRTAAFASAVVRQSRHDLVHQVALPDLGWVAGRLGGGSIDQFRCAVDAALEVMLRPLATAVPDTLDIKLEADDSGGDRRLSFEVREVESDDPFAAFKAAVEGRDQEQWQTERDRAAKELSRFVNGVIAEGAGALVQSNWLHGLNQVVTADVPHARGWAGRILSADRRACDQIQAFAASLAAALAPHDPSVAAQLFNGVLHARAIVDTLIGRAKVPLRLHALFRAPSHPEIDALRSELFIAARNDADVETLVVAATSQGAEDYLDQLVEVLIASPIPAREALALTISGFRNSSSTADQILAKYDGLGYLGSVAKAARDVSRRARWFQRWKNEALQSDDSVAYWRAADLASRCVSRAGLIAQLDVREGSPAWLHLATWLERLAKGAEKRTKKRGDLLYGLKKPMR